MNACTPVEVTRMRSGKGRFVNRPTYSKDKEYPKFFIYVPTEVARDSLFPFNDGEKVTIRIDDGRLIIERA
ncbi:MAG: hypothetical protein PHH85_03435 [Candidatus Methanoperedens sp.]|nr:hypothetical protein [Candidatus Methanoperedens sp.]